MFSTSTGAGSGVTFDTIWALLLAIANHPSTRALVQHLAGRAAQAIRTHITQRGQRVSTEAAQHKAEAKEYRALTDEELLTVGSRSTFARSGWTAEDRARYDRLYTEKHGFSPYGMGGRR